ncbi:class I SAM-dependent methyltransferase [Desulforamulus ferrireducens]|uniref:Methyltransferase type 11 n=1 Tax=Desulforamulus ferrireducens TaxID=1833852 RepID=A0A1S6IU69_9FIRM|nr:class I SAM-dependent methyltransferase [Desulforamulus ferrireducens]AQS58317.1 methyltransferase type 11 [Desulforamulus ferrireducens]
MYKELSQYYDDIFPTGNAQLNFFRQLFTDNGVSRVLDVACGSGNYALEFARWGLNVVGIDYEQEMIKLAREKARKEGLAVDFHTGDMRKLDSLEGKFDAVVCIGNSLVHLLNDKDLLLALNQMKERLYYGGLLLIQTINYDRILKGNITQLPDIVNHQAGLVFTRHYEFRADGLINFITSLVKNGPNGSQECLGSGQVPLRPLTRKQLEESLVQANFQEIEVYGGFDRRPHSWDSQATVIKASRRRSCILSK